MGARYTSASAGMGAWHVGECPDARMRQVAAGHGFHYDGRARQFSPTDFDRFDWIVVMDVENRNSLWGLARSAADRDKIRLLREFDPERGPAAPVPDPYYGELDGFEAVYEIVKRSCEGLLAALEAGTAEGAMTW